MRKDTSLARLSTVLTFGRKGEEGTKKKKKALVRGCRDVIFFILKLYSLAHSLIFPLCWLIMYNRSLSFMPLVWPSQGKGKD